jgi:3-deoxy-7-phosphoheptulonate synthase
VLAGLESALAAAPASATSGWAGLPAARPPDWAGLPAARPPDWAGLPAARPPDWAGLPAAQQPDWGSHPELTRCRRLLAAAPPLTGPGELAELAARLADVAAGRAVLLQAGDCAEDPADCSPAGVAARVAVLGRLATGLAGGHGLPVVAVGRMGGQFAKPRSRPTELHRGRPLPSFRGHMINGPGPSAAARRHDPRRLVRAYQASAVVQDCLRRHRRDRPPGRSGPWSSHEALVLDYEGSLVRADPATGRPFLGSTHLPWVGERTRQLDHAHLHLLAAVTNPLACKVGPRMDPATVARLCDVLDPDRVPGRLTLVTRMGRHRVRAALPPVVAAVRRAGHPVTWLCDPMHGNTVAAAGGRKTRYLADLLAETAAFRAVLERQRVHPAGLHLEVAAGEVTECVGGAVPDEATLGRSYRTLCDPRLTADQAEELIAGWL